jgi:hypothetical protein
MLDTKRVTTMKVTLMTLPYLAFSVRKNPRPTATRNIMSIAPIGRFIVIYTSLLFVDYLHFTTTAVS